MLLKFEMRNATTYYKAAYVGNALRGEVYTLNSHAYEKTII